MKFIKPSYQRIVFAALALAVVLYIGAIWNGFLSLLGVFSAVIFGGLFAFVFNVPMKRLENLLARCKVPEKWRRSLALVLLVVCLVLIITGVAAIILPTLASAVSQLTGAVQKAWPRLQAWLASTGLLNSSQIQQFTNQFQSSDIMSRAIAFLQNLTGNASSIFSNAMTVIMSLFLAFVMLASKEQLGAMTLRVMRVTFPEKVVKQATYVGNVAIETYDNFLMGQIIEAVIIGVLVFAAYGLIGLPYAGLTGVLAGVLSFIPYIGPWTACGLGAIFIATVDPFKALLSVAVFAVIQLVEGNLIYPHVVGKSVGLPTLFTLIAALVGGSLFGLLGMIFFTPVFAVIYRLVREYVESKEEEQATSE